MTHTQTFIELATEGGWRAGEDHYITVEHMRTGPGEYEERAIMIDERVLFDPLAWQAVQFSMWKQNKWMEATYGEYIQRFVGHLIGFKTPEEALGEILK